MLFAVPESALIRLEAAVATADAATRPLRQLEWAWHLRQRDSARAARLLAEAEAGLNGRTWPSEWRARVALLAGELDVLAGRYTEAEARLREVRDPSRSGAAGDRDAIADAFFLEALLAKAAAQPKRELLALERARACLQGGGDAQRLGIAEGMLACEAAVGLSDAVAASTAWAHGADSACQALQHFAQGMRLWSRDPATAIGLLLQAAAEAQDAGLVRLSCIATLNAGNLHGVLGDYDEAARHLGQAAARAARTGWPLLTGMTRAQVGAFLRLLNRPAEGRDQLVEALRHLRIAPPGPAHANACSELARTYLALGRAHEAQDLAAESVRIWRGLGTRLNLAPALMLQARAATQLGLGAPAQDLLNEAGALIADQGHTAMVPEWHEGLSLVHGLAGSSGRDALQRAFEEGQRALEAGARLPGWRASPALLRHVADMAARCQDFDAAYRFSERANAAQQEADLLKLRNPQAVLAMLSGGTWTDATAGSTDARALAGDFTPREFEVLTLLGRGYSNKRIADSLGLGEQTVKWHLKSVYGKLQVGTRHQAVMRARSQGLLDVPA